MAGIKKKKRFFGAMSGLFKRQTGFDVPMATSLINKRIKAAITYEEVITSEPVYDCDEQDQVDESINGKLMRITIAYTQISAQILFGWICYLLSSYSKDSAAQLPEIQTFTGLVAGDVINFDFNGKASMSAALAGTETPAQFKALLEAMDAVGENQVESVTGTIGAGLVVTFGGKFDNTNLPLMTVTGTGAAAQTQAGSNNTHHAVRSTDDVLAYFAMVTGFKADAATLEKFYNCVCDSIALTLNRRRDLGATITILGRFTPAELLAFTVPDCDLPHAIHGSECRIEIDSAFETDKLFTGSVTLNNSVPVDEDSAFAFDGDEVADLSRGEKPTYPVSLQILGSKGDSIYTKAKNRQTVDLKIHLGEPAERVSLIFPNARLALASGRLVFAGTAGKSAIPLDVVPYKDETLESPVRAEAQLTSQSTAFLLTS